METSGGGLIAILSSEAKTGAKKCRVTGGVLWDLKRMKRRSKKNRAFYGRDFEVWQFIIFGLFHFDYCCGMFPEIEVATWFRKWVNSFTFGSLQGWSKRPKGVLTSSGTSLPLRVCQDFCDAGKGRSGKLDPACRHQFASWWATGTNDTWLAH